MYVFHPAMKEKQVLMISGIVLLVVLLSAAFIIISDRRSDEQGLRRVLDNPVAPYEDPWSRDCERGLYMIGDGACGPLLSCVDDVDCAYLDIERRPSRVGRCVKGICHAECGLGTTHTCVH